MRMDDLIVLRDDQLVDTPSSDTDDDFVETKTEGLDVALWSLHPLLRIAYVLHQVYSP